MSMRIGAIAYRERFQVSILSGPSVCLLIRQQNSRISHQLYLHWLYKNYFSSVHNLPLIWFVDYTCIVVANERRKEPTFPVNFAERAKHNSRKIRKVKVVREGGRWIVNKLYSLSVECMVWLYESQVKPEPKGLGFVRWVSWFSTHRIQSGQTTLSLSRSLSVSLSLSATLALPHNMRHFLRNLGSWRRIMCIAHTYGLPAQW